MSTNPAERQTREQRRAAAREERAALEAAQAQSQARRKRLLQLGGGLVAVIAVVAIVIAVTSGGGSSHKLATGQKPAGTALVAREFAGIPENGTTLGSPNAPVTMVEFADLKCPICREYSLNILPKLLSKYVKTGKLQIRFAPQHFVGQPASDTTAAATFTLAAALQDKMWRFAELFYLNQQDENTEYVSDDYLRQISSGVTGLNASQALKVRGSDTIANQLQSASALFESEGFTGTPSFTVGATNGTQKPIDTSQLSLSEFTSAIDKMLKT